jgi:hypothetical protein
MARSFLAAAAPLSWLKEHLMLRPAGTRSIASSAGMTAEAREHLLLNDRYRPAEKPNLKDR